jgi:hypothetical protein
LREMTGGSKQDPRYMTVEMHEVWRGHRAHAAPRDGPRSRLRLTVPSRRMGARGCPACGPG